MRRTHVSLGIRGRPDGWCRRPVSRRSARAQGGRAPGPCHRLGSCSASPRAPRRVASFRPAGLQSLVCPTWPRPRTHEGPVSLRHLAPGRPGAWVSTKRTSDWHVVCAGEDVRLSPEQKTLPRVTADSGLKEPTGVFLAKRTAPFPSVFFVLPDCLLPKC